ncbi:PAS domain-containing protein [candidate division GN15 bacterium]|nr:PAS domain-containing protein [candidate division GN15 bacterium]
MEEQPRRRFSDRIIDAIPGYMTVQDRDLRIVETNEVFRNDFGDSEGRYCYQVYKNRPEKCENCPVERTFRDGQRHRSEEVVTTLDGRKVSVLVNTMPIRDDNGHITGVVEMSTDVTEMKSLQQQLTDSRAKYHQLFEEVPCFVSIQDQDLRIVDANRHFREAFGANYGCKCYNVYKHRTEECYPCVVRQTFHDGKMHYHEEVVTAKNGRRMNVLVTTMPLRDGNGNIEHVLEMSTDITTIRQLQSKLASIGLLISSISHSMKGLLNSLDGGVYLVNSGLAKDDSDRIAQGWEIAQRNIQRIRSTVLDILYYAKDREPDWETISVEDLLDEVYGILMPKADKLGIALDRKVGANTGKIEADPRAVRSMLVNIIENSLDACRVASGAESRKVDLILRGFDNHVEIEVIDNGIGMDQETREKAFSLFFSSKGTEGTGLGLFIANKIAIEHGGTITLESELNKGSRFLVNLPRGRPVPTGVADTEDIRKLGDQSPGAESS